MDGRVKVNKIKPLLDKVREVEHNRHTIIFEPACNRIVVAYNGLYCTEFTSEGCKTVDEAIKLAKEYIDNA